MFGWEASGTACSTQATTTPTDKARRLIMVPTRADPGSNNPSERPLSMFGLNSPCLGFLRPTRAIVRLTRPRVAARDGATATTAGSPMLPRRRPRINSVSVKTSTSRFMDTVCFDNRMGTITKREECHASRECHPINAADQHCFVLCGPNIGRRGHAGSADQCRQRAAQLVDEPSHL